MRNLIIMLKIIKNKKKIGREFQVPFYFLIITIPGAFSQWGVSGGLMRHVAEMGVIYR